MKERLLIIAENLSIFAKNCSVNLNVTLQGLPAVACASVGCGAICYVVHDFNKTKLLMHQKESEAFKDEQEN